MDRPGVDLDRLSRTPTHISRKVNYLTENDTRYQTFKQSRYIPYLGTYVEVSLGASESHTVLFVNFHKF